MERVRKVDEVEWAVLALESRTKWPRAAAARILDEAGDFVALALETSRRTRVVGGESEHRSGLSATDVKARFSFFPFSRSSPPATFSHGRGRARRAEDRVRRHWQSRRTPCCGAECEEPRLPNEYPVGVCPMDVVAIELRPRDRRAAAV